ncbi:MAG: hypothetical protein JSS02_22450, partial [Planctomycetes bacterium]|nr:hypothetical protein [Planctomycetota bacterium]
AAALTLVNAAGGSGTFSTITDNQDGTYTALFTGTTAGTNAIKGSLNGGGLTSVAPSVLVTPGAPSLLKSVVTLSSATVVAGNSVTATLQLADAAGNKLTTGGQTVAFLLGSPNGGQGTFGTVTDNLNGTYTTKFTGSTAGANTITATIGGQTLTSGAPSISVAVGSVSLASSTIAIASAKITSGTTTTVTLQARDSVGNKLATGGLTVTFGLGGNSGALGTFGAVTDNKNGTYTAVFTGTIAGTNTISAKIGGQPVTSAGPSFTVTPGAVSLAKSAVTLSSGSVTSGSTITALMQAYDAAGNKLTTGGSTVVFSLGANAGASGTFGAVKDNLDGTYTSVFTGVLAGTNTIKPHWVARH